MGRFGRARRLETLEGKRGFSCTCRALFVRSSWRPWGAIWSRENPGKKLCVQNRFDVAILHVLREFGHVCSRKGFVRASYTLCFTVLPSSSSFPRLAFFTQGFPAVCVRCVRCAELSFKKVFSLNCSQCNPWRLQRDLPSSAFFKRHLCEHCLTFVLRWLQVLGFGAHVGSKQNPTH